MNDRIIAGQIAAAQSKIHDLTSDVVHNTTKIKVLSDQTNDVVRRLQVYVPSALAEAERVANELIGHEKRIAALETKILTMGRREGGGRKKSKKKRTKRRRR